MTRPADDFIILSTMAQALYEQWAEVRGDDKPFDALSAAEGACWRLVAARSLQLAPGLLADPQSSRGMHVTTLYSRRDHEPVVQVEFDEPLKVLQVRAREMTEFALHLVEASNAAITDAFVLEFMRDRIGADEQHLFAIIREFRQWREARIARDPGDAPGGVVQT